MDSFLDPAVQGRWERTPIVLPILSRLDVIDEPPRDPPGMRPVISEDLIPIKQEYVLSEGDLVTVSIFELMQPNVETQQTRRVDELGQIRLPVLGRIQVAGQTTSGLEERIIRILQERGILKDPTVSVIVQESRKKTFSVLGSDDRRSVGIYNILHDDFRLIDALALAGIATTSKRIFVIRQVDIGTESDGAQQAPAEGDEGKQPPAQDSGDLIKDLLKGLDVPEPLEPAKTGKGTEPPAVLESSLDSTSPAAHWANVQGQWQRVDGPEGDGAPVVDSGVRQVVIEVPYDKLTDGNLEYNIVIRPGDIIRIPSPSSGNVYIGGAIARPGTYAIPGDRELTLRQLIFSAGGFSSAAFAERVDLIRRMDNDQEVMMRLNLRGIYDGTQPNFYIKPNDTINIGTSPVALGLALVRNGIRLSYGFGFVFDRNFASATQNN
ncbi:MAG: hypothetical protein GC164_08415 [Phycisphaera sp.]|nr:hypothetical protein [Phycisphaera sp.]